MHKQKQTLACWQAPFRFRMCAALLRPRHLCPLSDFVHSAAQCAPVGVEVRVKARLQHITACFNLAQHRVRQRRLAVFADKKCVYLLMEYVPGGELFKRLHEACARLLSHY